MQAEATHSKPLRIAVLGVGPIGSTLALHLARRGHDVTVVARRQRLEQLQRDGAIVTVAGERAPVTVNGALDPEIEYDLVVVTVLAHGVQTVLPTLAKSRAKTVMFMFNTFDSLDALRDAVGADRFAFGFPAILATLPDGKLESKIFTVGQRTIVTDKRWADLFRDAGIETDVERDMQSWLRTHAAMIVVVQSMAARAYEQKHGIAWRDAREFAGALKQAFGAVRTLGNVVTPSAMAGLSHAPNVVIASILWALSRLPIARTVGAAGTAEPRALIDAMLSASPTQTDSLRSIRPA